MKKIPIFPLVRNTTQKWFVLQNTFNKNTNHFHDCAKIILELILSFLPPKLLLAVILFSPNENSITEAMILWPF